MCEGSELELEFELENHFIPYPTERHSICTKEIVQNMRYMQSVVILKAAYISAVMVTRWRKGKW